MPPFAKDNTTSDKFKCILGKTFCYHKIHSRVDKAIDSQKYLLLHAGLISTVRWSLTIVSVSGWTWDLDHYARLGSCLNFHVKERKRTLFFRKFICLNQ